MITHLEVLCSESRSREKVRKIKLYNIDHCFHYDRVYAIRTLNGINLLNIPYTDTLNI